MPAVNGTLSFVSYLETDFPTRWVCAKGAAEKEYENAGRDALGAGRAALLVREYKYCWRQ
jgi:hypothetical protein